MYINKIKTIRSRSTLPNTNNQIDSLSKMFRNQSISKDLNQTANEMKNQFKNINIPQFIKKYNYLETNTQNNKLFHTLGKSSYEKMIKPNHQTISPKNLSTFPKAKQTVTLQLKRKSSDYKNLNQSTQNIDENDFILSGSNKFQVIKPLLKGISKKHFYEQLDNNQTNIFAKASQFKLERKTFRKLSIIPNKKKEQQTDISQLTKFLPYYRLPKLNQENLRHNFLFKQKYKMRNAALKSRYYSPELEQQKPIRNSYSPWQNLTQTKGQWQYKTLQK